MERVLVLNADYNYLNVIDWKRALRLVVNKKVEVVEYLNVKISSASGLMLLPKVLRLLKLVKIVFKNKVPMTKKNVFVRDNFECGYCGNKHDELTIDHVIPKSRGGKLSFENAVSCCSKCNNKKGDRTPEEAGMKLQKSLYAPTVAQFLGKRIKSLSMDFSYHGVQN